MIRRLGVIDMIDLIESYIYGNVNSTTANCRFLFKVTIFKYSL